METAPVCVSQERARSIMGNNFLGIEEACDYFRYSPLPLESNSLRDVPFSEATLGGLKESHILAAVFPLSIVDMCAIERVSNEELLQLEPWHHHNKSFAKKRREGSCWQLICKTFVPCSIEKQWEEQIALLRKNCSVPSARIMAYVLIGHYFQTGERLFGDIHVRTSSVSCEQHVLIGHFNEKGIDVIDSASDSEADVHIGICSLVKPAVSKETANQKKAKCF